MNTLSVAVCEMTSGDDWGLNQKTILEKLNSLPKPVPKFVSFPENSLYLRLNDKDKFEPVPLEHRIFDPLQEFARKQGTLIHLGSVPLAENDAHFNATVLLFPDGKREAVYKKMHLFDVDIQGHRAYRESDLYKHGSRPSVFEWLGWKFGASICYDLRFAELYHVYARQKVDVILVPSAFTVPTGRAHWSVLLRARAIESQAYVLAAAQQGSHGGKRETYGHSMIVGPWGDIFGEAHPGETLLATLDKEKIQAARSQIPMDGHRHDLSKFKF